MIAILTVILSAWNVSFLGTGRENMKSGLDLYLKLSFLLHFHIIFDNIECNSFYKWNKWRRYYHV